MVAVANHSRRDLDSEEVGRRLFKSAMKKGRYPDEEIDYEKDLNGDWGLVPESSTLYNTHIWYDLTQEEQKRLTRFEMGNIMQTGIWFEMILQVMLLRDLYGTDVTTDKFRWGIREIEEECRHTLMFSKVSEKLTEGNNFLPPKAYLWVGKHLMLKAKSELAYASILVAEEILDILQRANRSEESIELIVRQANDIHIFEESRHMAFARQEIRDNLKDRGKVHKFISGGILAIAASVIVTSLVSPKAYKKLGINPKSAVSARKHNQQYRMFLKTASRELIGFLDEVGLINNVNSRIYRHIGMM